MIHRYPPLLILPLLGAIACACSGASSNAQPATGTSSEERANKFDSAAPYAREHAGGSENQPTTPTLNAGGSGGGGPMPGGNGIGK